MSDRLMSAEEIERMTGCVTTRAQVHWFRENGWKVAVSAAGAPVLTPTNRDMMEKERPVTIQPLPSTDEAIRPKHMLRSKPSVYFLMDGDRVVYVGKSTDLPLRIATHSKSEMEWTSASHFHCDAGLLNIAEMEFIARLRPRYNKAGVSSPKECA